MKPTTDFYRQKKAKDGLQAYCKGCDKARAAAYRKAVHSLPEGRKKGQRWRVGDTFGTLTVVAVTRRYRRPTLLSCTWSCGNTRDGIRADLVPTLIDRTCGDPARHAELRPGNYNATHLALSRHHGAAETHACLTCGGRASQWSYLGRRDKPGMDVDGNHKDSPWSWIRSDYVPMCLACHRAWEDSDHMLSKRGVGHTELAELLSLAQWGEEVCGEWMDESELTSGVNVYGEPVNAQ